MNKDDLQLKSFYINLRTYWNDIWKYFWKVTFTNEKEEEFTFNIEDEEMKLFIKLIAKQVSNTANTFTNKLKNLFLTK